MLSPTFSWNNMVRAGGCFNYLLLFSCFVSANMLDEADISTKPSPSKKYCNDLWRNYKGATWKIIGGGGVDALREEFPYMAALGYGNYPNITWACGGTLITANYVMTAAHCTVNVELGEVKVVRLGVVVLRSNDSEDIPQDVNVKNIIRHPDYHPALVYNDIALLELSKPAVFSYSVRPGCLHTESTINASRWIATGWGALYYNGPYADHLQELRLKEFSHEECKKSFHSQRRLKHGLDNITQICAGEVKTDLCEGDSGGPLQIRHPEFWQTYSIIGITSFGTPCLLTNNPGVYTRVSHYIKWIESIIWKSGN